MTYNAREIAADAGAPFELYEFVRGVQRWRYASGDRAIVWNGNTFAPATLSRSSIEVGQEIARQGLRISATREVGIVDAYRVAPPSDPVLVTIWQAHDGDPDDEFVVVWQGRIVAVEWQGSAADIACESVFTSLRRSGLRRAWQRLCPHVLYGSECRVVKTSYQVNATLSAVSGGVLTSTAFGSFASGYFLGGLVEWSTPAGVIERRPIVGHAGNAITIDRVITTLSAGDIVAAFPGCDHSTGASGCARFSNILNFGGTPYIPTKNPFGGDPVY